MLGDLAEKQLSESLKELYADSNDKEVVVLQGPVFKSPGTKKDTEQEPDFIIIAKNIKCIICTESERSLYGKTAEKGLEQLKSMKMLVEKYFGPMFLSGEWNYVALIHFEKNTSKLKICKDCHIASSTQKM